MNTMRRLIALMLVCLTMLPIAALAGGQAALPMENYVTLGDLRMQALNGWHETYATAQGGEVPIHVDIAWMPQTDVCPIVYIETREVDPALVEPYQGPGNIVKPTAPHHAVDIIMDSPMRTWLMPGMSRSVAADIDVDDIKYAALETPEGMPEGMDCTYEQFEAMLNGYFKRFFDKSIADYWLESRQKVGINWLAKKVDGQWIRQKQFSKTGSWHARGWRMFHGIPLNHAWESPYGYFVFNYYGEQCFSFSAHSLEETALVAEDVPLLSFDAIKGKLREQMDLGYLRIVDEMQFCYLPFPKGGQWELRPFWRILGGYSRNLGKNVLPYYDERDTDGSLTVPSEYYHYYFDAQTGAMVDTAPIVESYKAPTGYPEFITWDGVGGRP